MHHLPSRCALLVYLLVVLRLPAFASASAFGGVAVSASSDLTEHFSQPEPVHAEKEGGANSAPYFFVNFYGDGDLGQCNGGAYGVQSAVIGEWTSPIRLDTDGRAGGCFQQFSVADPAGSLAGLNMMVNFYPDGDAQCDSPGLRNIPVSPYLVWSTPYRIDTDNRSGGCQQIFSIQGRSDVVMDISFWADGDPGQCGNTGVHTVSINHPVQLRLDMDNRNGGCWQSFRLRKL